jgi:hypothetical protein
VLCVVREKHLIAVVFITVGAIIAVAESTQARVSLSTDTNAVANLDTIVDL